jgi:tRNA(Ile)-lysidine synthase
MASVEQVLRLTERSGLIPASGRVLVLLSGGADSVCLLDVVGKLAGCQRVGALHVNHGLRAGADRDESFCVSLCERLAVELHIERLDLACEAGNLEARARTARYEAAERVRAEHGFAVIATGHTATDQAETVLFRLASSPGRRSLLGIAPRSGRVVRPLLAVTGDQTEAYCRESDLGWVEDPTNADISLARNRIRQRVLEDLRRIHPAVTENIVATAAELRDEAALLDAAVDEAQRLTGAGGDPPAVEAARLRSIDRALRRLLLRRLAEQVAGTPIPLGGDDVAELERLATGPGSSYVDLPGGVRAACEYGVIRFRGRERAKDAGPCELAIPGSCKLGSWIVSSELEPDPQAALASISSRDEAVVDAAALGSRATVRRWLEGDRMQPLGMSGTKSLQDLFTDRKIPRSLRGQLPVVLRGGAIVWVAGVATSEQFKVSVDSSVAVRLRARLSSA